MEVRIYTDFDKHIDDEQQEQYAALLNAIDGLSDGTLTIQIKDGKIKSIDQSRKYVW